MYKRLIIYSTTDGQTKLICERIKNLSKFNNETKLLEIDKAKKEDLSGTKAIQRRKQIEAKRGFIKL